MNAPSSLRHGLRTLVVLLAFLSTWPASAGEPIPPRMYSVERAGVFHLDRAVLEERFRAEHERCQDTPGEGYDQVSCLLLEGMVQCFSGERDAGLATFQEAIDILEGMNDRFGTVLIHVAMAEAERQMRYPDEAIRIYRDALTVVESLAGSTEPIGIESFGLFARLAGMPADFVSQLGPMARMMGPLLVSLLEVMVRDSFATLLLAENQPAEAEEQLKLALPLSRSLLGMMDAQVLDHLGQVRERQSKLDEAGELFRQAIAATKLTGDVERRFFILRRLAEVETASGRLDDALATLESGRRLAHEQGDLAREAWLLTDLIDFHYHHGEIGKARDVVEEALNVAEESGDAWTIATARSTAAGIAMATGAYEQAAAHLDAASSRLAAIESWRPEVAVMQVNALIELSEVYFLLGREQQMTEKAVAAQEIARQAGYGEGAAMSRLLEEWGRFVEAAAVNPKASSAGLGQAASAFRQALATSDVLSLREFSESFGPALESFSLLTDPEGSAVLRGQAWLAEAEDVGQLWSRGFGHIAAAAQEARAGRYPEARRLFEEFHRDIRRLKQKDLEALSLAAIAVLHWKSGEAELAVSRAKESIDVFETLVGGVHVDDLLAAFLGSDRRWLYQVAIEFLARTGKVAEAFDMAERARARALLHQLGNQRLNAFDGDSELIGRLDDLRREILALERNPSANDAVRQKREQYDELFIQAKLRHPEYTGLVSVDPLDLATLQGEVLAPRTTLVAYYVTVDRILAWIVDREAVEMVSLPTSPDEMQEIVCLAERSGHESTRGARPRAGCAGHDGLPEKYFAKLIEPLLPHVRYEQLILVPHGALHYVPFAALRDKESERYLLEMKTVSYAPSVSVLRFLAEKASPFDGDVLVLGDPQTDLGELPWARDEARTVAELFGTQPLVGADASESRIRASAGKVDLLHLAAHGVYRPRTPRFSHVALAAGGGDDGLLEVVEVFSALDLRGVNLVTLSACRTALGERNDGDEIKGLTRAFLYAGSPAVVSTLWWVDDKATAFLMKAFYERLLAGASYAEALRTAQLETSSQPGWSDPFYWAAFTLTGDPEGRWNVETPKESPGASRQTRQRPEE